MGSPPSSFPSGASGKEPDCQCRRHKRCGFDPWVGKIPWKRAWQPTSVCLPGESHRQRSLEGYSPWGHKESDTTEATEHAHMQMMSKKITYGLKSHPWKEEATDLSFPMFNTKEKVLVTQSCPKFCDPMDCSPSGFSVHGISQARILKWAAIPFFRGSSRPRD